MRLRTRAGAATAEAVPTLGALLDLAAPAAVGLLPEIKVGAKGQRYPGIEEKVLGLLRARGLLERATIQAFQPETLRRLRELDGKARTMLLVSRGDVERDRARPAEVVRRARDLGATDLGMFGSNVWSGRRAEMALKLQSTRPLFGQDRLASYRRIAAGVAAALVAAGVAIAATPAPPAAKPAPAAKPTPPAAKTGGPDIGKFVPDANMERADVPDQFKWSLTPLFPSDADFARGLAEAGPGWPGSKGSSATRPRWAPASTSTSTRACSPTG